MLPITMTITNAGLDALVNAQSGDTAAIEVSEVGLSETAFEVAPTITALPGEFKRISTVSGLVVAPNIIHMTAQDPTADIYDLRSIALYLSDGTLFAVYAQTAPLFSKVSVATFLLALDLAFSSDIAGSIEFGNTDFLYPPATETEKGVAEIATQAEVDAETDDGRIVTPKKLAVRLGELVTSFAFTLLAAANAAAARSVLGLGALAVKDSVNGSDWSGAVLAVADGGTGASTAAGARSNLGLDTLVVPSGAVFAFAMNAAPSGYLECDGAAVSRATYAALFAAIDTTHGTGDGSTTFNLPDLRGEFVRGWDHGRGVDAARSFGSAQAADLQSHNHTTPLGADEGDVTSSTTNGNGAGGALATSFTGGSETRPRNIALLYAIKT